MKCNNCLLITFHMHITAEAQHCQQSGSTAIPQSFIATALSYFPAEHSIGM